MSYSEADGAARPADAAHSRRNWILDQQCWRLRSALPHSARNNKSQCGIGHAAGETQLMPHRADEGTLPRGSSQPVLPEDDMLAVSVDELLEHLAQAGAWSIHGALTCGRSASASWRCCRT